MTGWSQGLGLPFGEKQLDYILDSTARINLSEGSVRSGKTIGSIIRWLDYVSRPYSGELVIAGKTRDTVYRNIFRPMMDPSITGAIAGRVNYRQGAPTARILGQPVHVIGANDNLAETKIRGMTVGGCLLDEATLIPETFFRQMLARMSPPGAMMFATTNPDNKRHWLKRNFIDRASELDMRVWHFTLDDNPALSPQYVKSLKAEYTGLWYKRFISGLWVSAEGAIYDGFDTDRHVEDEVPLILEWIGVGVDYGTTNPFSALLAGIGVDGRVHVVSEYRWDSHKERRQLSDREYADAVREWLSEYKPPGSVYPGVEDVPLVVDPSAASFVQELWRGGFSPEKASNRVQDGIRAVSNIINRDVLRIHASCTGLIDELSGYVWDEKQLLRGVEAPLKVDDHGPDALRYLVATTAWSWRDSVPALADAA